MKLDVDLPVALLPRLAAVVESTGPHWPFRLKPQFVHGSCMRFFYRGTPVATATAAGLKVPSRVREPWYVMMEDVQLVVPGSQ